jgi:hypothetical protein
MTTAPDPAFDPVETDRLRFIAGAIRRPLDKMTTGWEEEILAAADELDRWRAHLASTSAPGDPHAPETYGCTPEACATTPSRHCCVPWDVDDGDGPPRNPALRDPDEDLL